MPKTKKSPKCIYPDCSNTVRTRGLCHGHYMTMRRLVREGKITEEDLEERGFLSPKGTGQAFMNGHALFLDPNARGNA